MTCKNAAKKVEEAVGITGSAYALCDESPEFRQYCQSYCTEMVIELMNAVPTQSLKEMAEQTAAEATTRADLLVIRNNSFEMDVKT